MLIWLLFFIDIFVAMFIGAQADAVMGKLVYALLSFAVLALLSFLLVGLLSYCFPRRKPPRIKSIKHYDIIRSSDTLVYFYIGGKEHTLLRGPYEEVPIMPGRKPFVEVVNYTEGGLAGYWLFDVYKYPKEYIIYIQET